MSELAAERVNSAIEARRKKELAVEGKSSRTASLCQEVLGVA